MSLTMRGRSGGVLVGPYVAAELGPWTWTGSGGAGTIQAEVRRVDPFWGSQAPTAVQLELGARRWRWVLQDGSAASGTYATHGPPEVR